MSSRQKFNNYGYSLIELMLVLSIGALLSLILVRIQGEQTNRSRFSASMEEVTSFMIQARAEANATIGDFDRMPGTDQIVFGKVVEFDAGNPGVVTSTTLLAQNRTDNQLCNVVATDPVKTFEIPWEVEYTDAISQAVVFGRSPIDGAFATYLFLNPTEVLLPGSCASGGSPYMRANDPAAATQHLDLVFRNPRDYQATLKVGKDGEVRLNYDQ